MLCYERNLHRESPNSTAHSTSSKCLFRDCYPQDVAQILLFPFLQDFVEQFVLILTSSNEANLDPGLRKETIMALCNLLRWFPSTMHSQVVAVVTPVWSCLTSNTELYPF